jgi:hypothetical protein
MAGHIPDRILIFIPMRESGIFLIFFRGEEIIVFLKLLPIIHDFWWENVILKKRIFIVQ